MTRSTSDGPAPSNRVGPRRIVAIVVAALLVVGVGGLFAVAIWGGDAPTGDGLQQRVDVDAPATATASPTERESSAGAAPAPPVTPEAPAPETSSLEGGLGGDDFNVAPQTSQASSQASGDLSSAESLDSVVPPDEGVELPTPSEPVDLPDLVTSPPPASTVAAVPIAALDPETVTGFQGWDVRSRKDGYLQLSNGSQVIEVFVLDSDEPIATADDALADFFGEMRPDLQELTESAPTRLASPSSRYLSVSGAQFVAISAGQQGTRSITGSAIAGLDGDGVAVVVTATREGTSSDSQLAADAELLRALLAQVAP